jgi:hypothetical protein
MDLFSRDLPSGALSNRPLPGLKLASIDDTSLKHF